MVLSKVHQLSQEMVDKGIQQQLPQKVLGTLKQPVNQFFSGSRATPWKDCLGDVFHHG